MDRDRLNRPHVQPLIAQTRFLSHTFLTDFLEPFLAYYSWEQLYDFLLSFLAYPSYSRAFLDHNSGQRHYELFHVFNYCLLVISFQQGFLFCIMYTVLSMQIDGL